MPGANYMVPRSERLARLEQSIQEAMPLASAFAPHQTLSEFHARAKQLRFACCERLAFADEDPKWADLCFENVRLTPLGVSQALLLLQILKWRIEDGRSTSLNDHDFARLRACASLTIFADHIIDTAENNSRGFTLTVLQDHELFAKEALPKALEIVRLHASTADEQDTWGRSIDVVTNRDETASSLIALERAAQWRIGWALLALGWQLAEVGEDAITLHTVRFCRFLEAIAARTQFGAGVSIACPRCRSGVKVLSNAVQMAATGMVSRLWECEVCSIHGYFPLAITPDSVWAAAPAPRPLPNRRVSNQSLPSQADVVIICALHKPELEKLKSTGVDPWEALPSDPHDSTSYLATTYVTRRGRRLRIVAAAPNQMGMPASAVLATKMILRFRPKLVAMVGIAAGVRHDKQGFGDILAPDSTFDYNAGKIIFRDDKLSFGPDPNPIHIVPRLRDRLKHWSSDETQLHDIYRRWPAPKPPRMLQLHVGPLGSGAAVIDAAEQIQGVLEHWRKLIGIEMEAYGIHVACRDAAQPSTAFLCMKSICDFAANKGDDWQDFAAYTAAELFYRFVVEEWEDLHLGMESD